MEEKDVMEKVEQFRELSDKIATMFDEAHIEVGLVMSVLCYLYAKTAYEQTDLDAGKAILVVESSERHYRLFGTTLQAWRDMIKSQLSIVTKRPIIFRSKSDDKKNRDSLYQHLLDSDYYCVISDASAAAIEAVWAGVPIITLNRHFSVPVARTKLQDIDDLYRGPIGDWLCALTYSQFTRQEMFDGTAWQIIEKYHV